MSLPHIRVVAAEIERDGTWLITQRRAEATQPLLWEFPGGRVREGEHDKDALRRALRDRLGVEVQVGHQLLTVSHTYEAYQLTMVVYHCSVYGTPRAARVNDLAWVHPDNFHKFPFPEADQATVDSLLED